ncbi:uncharacterized protein LOC134290550 [Aedes albopictus]|uniref:Integrase catalytic domain-containing protein n=1 Tax=Aedes albopictus TaxID=7160 RepID=A0ABM1YQI3_AEDAL
MAPGLRELHRMERFYTNTLANAKQFMTDYDSEQHSGQLEGWKQRVDGLFQKFEANRLAIELLEEDQDEDAKGGDDDAKSVADEKHRVIHQRFELDYVLVSSFIANEIRKLALATPSNPPPQVAGQSRVKLPEVKLPTFDGTISEWITFRDSFKSLIDSNQQLTPFDKFSYLVASLTKDAKKVVESIELSAANYPVAWQLLEKRFENKKLILKTYLDALFAIDPMKRESYESLMRLVDDFERNLSMIDKMGVPTGGWSVLLAHMLCSRLDPSTLKQWESHYRSTDVPEYKDIIAFLQGHLSVLQSLPPSKSHSSESNKPDQQRPSKSKINTVHAVTSPATSSCPFCSKSSHSPFKCEFFQGLAVSQRFDLVKKKNLCINCFSPSHMLRSCSSSSCRVCNQKHHTMLHQSPNDRSTTPSKPTTPPVSRSSLVPPENPPASPNQSASQSQPTLSSSLENPKPSSSGTSLVSTTVVDAPRSAPATVLLQTAIVKVFSTNGHIQWARALLDPASQLNLITESLVQRSKLHRYQCHQEIGGVGNSAIVSSHAVLIQIGSHCTDFSVEQRCHILKKITRDLPSRSLDASAWTLPSNIILADPKFHEPGPIDLLLGMELYYDLLLEGFTKLGPEKPILQNTVFGWVASGKIGSSLPDRTPTVAHVCSKQPLDELISRFWEIESCWSPSTQSIEEAACEDHFAAHTFRDDSGRFVVTLPKQPSVLAQLGSSKEIATKRFLALERRHDDNPKLKEAYTAFIEEYHQLGHMRELDCSGTSSPAALSYYLPHHGVEKADSTTTKLRVVFDASCRTDSGVSLNQALMVGAVVQDDLFAIHLRFRMHRIAIIADIEKMYRQIRIHPSDYPLQRILWRSSSSEPLRTFELVTVTYGTASAPFLATRCLKELSIQGADNYPHASLVLGKDFYVDDMLTGVDNEEDGTELSSQLQELLQSAGFSLRKWASNSPAVLSNIPAKNRDERSVFALDSLSSPIKTLGILWNPSTDTYSYAVPEWSKEAVITRRVVASDTAKLFLPLGLLGPVVVLAKIFIQYLWQTTVSWDEPLTLEQQQYWSEFRDSLEDITSISIPRWAAFAHNPVVVELHGFCDASEKAYGACLYIRTVSSDGTISARLLAAKSKVAPTGKSKKQTTLTLPRLELSSALLLAHLYHKVTESVELKTKSFFWTDSMIALCQIRSPPARWKTFVANRVSEIQRLTVGGTWAHVPGAENPADIISRGMSPAQLKDTPAWWNGCQWLSQPSRFWPPINRPIPEDLPSTELEERSVSLPVQATQSSEIFECRSSFSSLVRVVAFLHRFRHNSSPRNRTARKGGPLSTLELNNATKTLVKLAQQEAFGADILAITSKGQVSSNSALKSLAPILVDGILRVGGRLRHAAISEDRKHPMILPARHTLTERILVHYHLKNLHAGPQLLVACVREKYWPLRIRNLARKVVHSCVNCFRCKPTNLEQLMGDLPPERVTPTLPFLNTGVDLCGPFQFRKLPRAPPVKCYVAIFVCLVTKAAHVELVYDLSTAAFLAALQRFVARRGRPGLIQCDNATNFKGAAKELAQLRKQFYDQQHQAEVISTCADDGTEFRFIPPRSPNFGGLWEAAVKSFKKHLRATIGNSVLSQDEFVTLLARIEACLNSRPLTALSADPNDLEVLTPGHFLVHRPLTAFPEPNLSEVPRNRLDRWQTNQELLRRVWKRWTIDYLSGLHPRTKWTQQRNNIEIGTLVLVKEDNLPPLKWRYGRIIRVCRGTDNNIRVVVVRTADGEYTRSISKICVLPVRQPALNDAGSINPNSED